MEKKKILSTPDQIKALSDPYRTKILNLYYNFKRPATVKQIADRLGEVPAKVYYHVKKLEAVGILTLVHTEVINGIVAKFYEPVAESFEIKSPEGTDAAYRKLMKNEYMKMITEHYDASRDLILSSVKISTDQDKISRVLLSSADLLIPEHEVQAFFSEMEALIERFDCSGTQNEQPEDLPVRKFHGFFSIAEIQ